MGTHIHTYTLQTTPSLYHDVHHIHHVHVHDDDATSVFFSSSFVCLVRKMQNSGGPRSRVQKIMHHSQILTMFTYQSKLKLPKDTEASELKEQVAQKVFELETKDADLRVELRDVKIVAVKELVLDADEGKSAIVIFVPVPNLRNVQKVFLHLVRELEKKFPASRFSS